MENRPSYWAVLPAQIRYDPSLPPNAKILYAEISALTNERGYCYADNAYFCQLYELSERTIIRLINALDKAGYISIKDGGNGKTNRKIYAGINPLLSSDKNVSSQKEVTKMSEGSDKNVSAIYSNNNIFNNKPPIVPQEGDGAARKKKEAQAQPDWKPDIFAAFWKSYPPVNGKRPAKARALKAWNKLKPDDKTIGLMSEALQRDKSSEMWKKGIGIPYASTWLNGRYWEDEPVENTAKCPEIPDSQEVYEQWS